MIGVLLDLFGEIVIPFLDPGGSGTVIDFFTAVIYPVVKVHRRSGSPSGTQWLLAGPAVRWSVGSIPGAHGSGDLTRDLDTRRRLEDLPANRRVFVLWDPWSRVIPRGIHLLVLRPRA